MYWVFCVQCASAGLSSGSRGHGPRLPPRVAPGEPQPARAAKGGFGSGHGGHEACAHPFAHLKEGFDAPICSLGSSACSNYVFSYFLHFPFCTFPDIFSPCYKFDLKNMQPTDPKVFLIGGFLNQVSTFFRTSSSNRPQNSPQGVNGNKFTSSVRLKSGVKRRNYSTESSMTNSQRMVFLEGFNSVFLLQTCNSAGLGVPLGFVFRLCSPTPKGMSGGTSAQRFWF